MNELEKMLPKELEKAIKKLHVLLEQKQHSKGIIDLVIK